MLACANAPFDLFVTKGQRWLNAGGAARGDDTGGNADRQKQDRYARNREWIVRGGLPELAGENAREREAGDESDRYPDGDDAKAHTEDEFERVGARCAERHADADFVRAPRSGVGDHAVYADRNECEADDREDRHQDESELRACVRLQMDVVLHRAGVGERDASVDSPHFAADG